MYPSRNRVIYRCISGFCRINSPSLDISIVLFLTVVLGNSGAVPQSKRMLPRADGDLIRARCKIR